MTPLMIQFIFKQILAVSNAAYEKKWEVYFCEYIMEAVSATKYK